MMHYSLSIRMHEQIKIITDNFILNVKSPYTLHTKSLLQFSTHDVKNLFATFRHTYRYNFVALKKVALRMMTSKEWRGTIPNILCVELFCGPILAVEGRKLSFTIMPTGGVLDHENQHERQN